MKLCPACEVEKDESEFGKNLANVSGLQSHCKACQREYRFRRARRDPDWERKTADMKAYQKAYREKNKVRHNELKARWVAKKTAEDPEWARERLRAKYERQQIRLHGPDWKPGRKRKTAEEIAATRRAKSRRRYRRKKEIHPEQYRSKLAVKAALANGSLLRQPCLVCGEKAEAHHPDYSRPLDVVWVCRKHHLQIHAEAKEWAKAEQSEK